MYIKILGGEKMLTVDEYKNYITNENNVRKIPTNFSKLDNIYGGGLSKGLTIIGANTGLGKTTFVLQLADNVAQQPDTKVLFISMELTKYELVSKSLSRLSYLDDNLTNHTPNDFISNGVDDLDTYYSHYEPIGNNVYIVDNIRSIMKLSKTIYDFCNEFEKDKVIVIIDYIQFINCNGNSDKQNVDIITRELKALANNYNIPIVAISSLSREGTKKNDLSSFKESGSIEYTADYLIIMYKKQNNRELAFTDDTDTITLEFLKNRFGVKGQFDLKYIGNYATFKEL